jgi:hypothetical protein
LTVCERELACIEHDRSRYFDRLSRIADARCMPEPSFPRSRRTSRRGASLAGDVDARGRPAIAAPATSAAAGQVGEDLELGDRDTGDVGRCRPGR